MICITKVVFIIISFTISKVKNSYKQKKDKQSKENKHTIPHFQGQCVLTPWGVAPMLLLWVWAQESQSGLSSVRR